MHPLRPIRLPARHRGALGRPVHDRNETPLRRESSKSDDGFAPLVGRRLLHAIPERTNEALLSPDVCSGRIFVSGGAISGPPTKARQTATLLTLIDHTRWFDQVLPDRTPL